VSRVIGRWRRGSGVLCAVAWLTTSACGGATTTPTTSSTVTTSPVTSPSTTSGVPASPVTHPTVTATPTTSPSILTGPGTQATYSAESQPAPGTCHYRYEGGDPLPDPTCTPGAVNPQVTQGDVGSTICRAGWTATVRPPVSVTGPEKVGSALAYDYTGSFATAEYDHLIPLELGGDPNDPANLWLEPNDLPGATSTHNGKDGLEATLRRLVCSGSMSLSSARQAIATDWVAAARRYDG
jgi:hypothetical protein